jgi:hypothetical protein
MMMNMLMGLARGSVVEPLPGGTADNTVASGSTAQTGWSIENDGQVINEENPSVPVVDHHWFLPRTNGIGGNYYLRATKLAGDNPDLGSSTLGIWGSLSGDRNWVLTNNVPGTTKSCTLLIEIALDAAGANVLASGTYILQATVNP